MDLQYLREQFPHISSGRIYLNHAATSPWSTYVTRMVDSFKLGRSSGEIELYPETIRITSEARELAAEMLGADADRISFVQNTSEGLSILASGLKWASGDRIILFENEFPSNVYPFLNLKRHGVEIDFVPQRDGCIHLDDIENAITPRTRLLSVSWVQFLSGFRINLEALHEICAAHGILLSLDAIQGVAAIQLDLRTAGVDFLAAGAHKWQMGPQGIGLVYLSADLQDRIEQSHMGWLSVKHPWDFFDYDLDLRDSAARYENGTYNSVGLHGYHGALSLFRETGFTEVQHLVRKNADYAYSKAAEDGYTMLTPENTAQRAGIVTFKHLHAEEIHRQLLARGITVSPRV